ELRGEVQGAVVDDAVAVVVAPITALEPAGIGQRARVVAVVAAGPRLSRQKARERRAVTVTVRVRSAMGEDALARAGVASVDGARIAVVARDRSHRDALRGLAAPDLAGRRTILVENALDLRIDS